MGGGISPGHSLRPQRSRSEPARRCDDFYEHKKAKRLPVVAMQALSHKLARAAYYMMRDGKPFEVQRCFG
jgi:hypothetical protein